MAKVHTANGSERESNGVLALRKEEEKLECDYLVVGAGASGLAFVDTMLTEIPSLKIIIVDKHEAPGGHWNDAYDFVRLHQPSVAYGVPSKQVCLTRFSYSILLSDYLMLERVRERKCSYVSSTKLIN